MRYSIIVLQAEIIRFKQAIKEATESIKLVKKYSKDKKPIKEAMKNYNIGLNLYEAQIIELKQAIKKLET